MQIGSNRNSKLLHKYKLVHILYCVGSGGSGGCSSGGGSVGDGGNGGSRGGRAWLVQPDSSVRGHIFVYSSAIPGITDLTADIKYTMKMYYQAIGGRYDMDLNDLLLFDLEFEFSINTFS